MRESSDSCLAGAVRRVAELLDCSPPVASRCPSSAPPAVRSLPCIEMSRTSIVLGLPASGLEETQRKDTRAACRRSTTARLDQVLPSRKTGTCGIPNPDISMSRGSAGNRMSTSASATVKLIGISCLMGISEIGRLILVETNAALRGENGCQQRPPADPPGRREM